MNSATLKPENVRKVKSFVTALMQGLECLPDHDAISLQESAIAFEELAREFRDRATAAEINLHAKNDVC